MIQQPRNILGKLPIYSMTRSFASGPALTQFRDILNSQLNAIKDAGTYKSERVITSAQRTEITVAGRKNSVLNFCANNYLGLAVSGGQLDDIYFIYVTHVIHMPLLL